MGEIKAMKFPFHVFRYSYFGIQVMCILALNGKENCSDDYIRIGITFRSIEDEGENMVLIGDVCFTIYKNLTKYDRATEICNITGGYLWEIPDRHSVFNKIQKNSNLSGEYWVNREADIKIDNAVGKELCHPSVRFRYEKAKGLTMNLHLYSLHHVCWTRLGYICKYEMLEADGRGKTISFPESDFKINGHSIIICVVAFIIIVGLLVEIIRLRQRNGVAFSSSEKDEEKRETVFGGTEEQTKSNAAQAPLPRRLTSADNDVEIKIPLVKKERRIQSTHEGQRRKPDSLKYCNANARGTM